MRHGNGVIVNCEILISFPYILCIQHFHSGPVKTLKSMYGLCGSGLIQDYWAYSGPGQRSNFKLKIIESND